MAFTVENHIPPAVYAISGNAHLHESATPAPTATPVNIIHAAQTLFIHGVWSQSGWAIPILSGQWRFNVYFELMGQGETPANPPAVTVPYNNSGPFTYNGVITIPGGTLTPGVYRVVTTLSLLSPSGTMSPLHAFDEEMGFLNVVP